MSDFLELYILLFNYRQNLIYQSKRKFAETDNRYIKITKEKRVEIFAEISWLNGRLKNISEFLNRNTQNEIQSAT